MRVKLLTREGERSTLIFDPEAPNITWRSQSPIAQYLVDHDGSVLLQPMFVKQWRGRRAVGHGLMKLAIERPIVGGPAVYGIGTAKTDTYYFMECWPPTFRLLNEILTAATLSLRKGRGAQHIKNLLNPSAVSELVKQSAITFENLQSKGYVFADFCHKNIMVERFKTFRFVDLDSCIPLPLADSAQTGQFDPTFWTLWKGHVESTDAAGEKLPKSLLLAFGAVWTRALALAISDGGLNEAVKLLSHTPTALTAQRTLWQHLSKGDASGFASFFPNSGKGPKLFQVWKRLFDDLAGGRDPSWRDVTAAIRGLIANLSEYAKVPASPPLSPTTLRPKPTAQKLTAPTADKPRAHGFFESIEPKRSVTLTPVQAVQGGKFRVDSPSPAAVNRAANDESVGTVEVPPCSPMGRRLATNQGDFAVVKIRETESFTILGNELRTSKEISSNLAKTGGTVNVFTPDDYVEMQIPQETVDGEIITMIGHGLPLPFGGRAALKVVISVYKVTPLVFTPSNISPVHSTWGSTFSSGIRGTDGKVPRVYLWYPLSVLLVLIIVVFAWFILGDKP